MSGPRRRLTGAGAVNHQLSEEELRDLCLGFLGTEETFPFGPETSVFKVADKMFALSRLADRPLRVSLKCEPHLAEQLRLAHPAVLPGYHLNKRHWNTVIIDGSLPEPVIRDMVEDSYDLVVSALPRSTRAALQWTGDPRSSGPATRASASRSRSAPRAPRRSP